MRPIGWGGPYPLLNRPLGGLLDGAEGTISDGQSQRPANAQPPQPTDPPIGAETSPD